MENIREIISTNILTLRKQNNLTQIELSKKINYSDKAISRWEKGEVLPDVETLQQLSKIFCVPLSYLFEEHNEIKLNNENAPPKKDLILHLLACCSIWVVISILFVYLKLFYNYTFWQVFIWGIPFTIAFSLGFYKKWNNKKIKVILKSILNWSILACIFLQFLEQNLWLVFIIGVPIQAYIIVSYFAPDNIKLFTFKSRKK